MKRYLLDSGVMSDFVNHRRGVDERARDARSRGARIGTCMPVVGELFGGVELSASREQNLKRLRAALSRMICWPFDRAAAEQYGRLYASLRRMGRPTPAIDIQIAAIALTLGDCTVVTTDSDFAAIPGLSVQNWAVASSDG